MVNEDSDLYRAHPDWAIRIPGKKPVRSRNQLLLDFSRKEVRDCVFDQICAVLDQGKIDYVKWDMNRSMADVYAGNLSYDYVLGVYDFMERLCSRYPDLLLEDAAVAAAGLTQECFIIPHRSGATTIPMRSTAQESSTELRFSIRFPRWGRMFRRCQITRPDG